MFGFLPGASASSAAAPAGAAPGGMPGMPPGGMPDMAGLMGAMNNPAMMQQVQSMMQNPAMMQMVRHVLRTAARSLRCVPHGGAPAHARDGRASACCSAWTPDVCCGARCHRTPQAQNMMQDPAMMQNMMGMLGGAGGGGGGNPMAGLA